jgi:hypothetical protein
MPLDQALELLEQAGNDPLATKRLIAKALDEKLAIRQRKEFAAPGGLMKFVRHYWKVLEPDKEFQEGWALDAMALHLEAVARGDITRLLINISPGACKSLLCSAFFPVWVWAALGRPGARFLNVAFAAHLPERDNRRSLSLINSPEFQRLYRKSFKLTKAGEELIENDKTGFKQAAGIQSVTGRRSDFLILDDPNNISDIESEVTRETVARTFKEAASNRLNDLTKSAIIVIQQRSHEDDVSGIILTDGMPYVHLCIPALFEEGRVCETYVKGKLFWKDPRETEGECFWPERYPPSAIAEEEAKGPFYFAGQFLQRPEPRGGGILKREYWREWTEPEFPVCDLVIASLDPAYTAKDENDPSGFTVWGTFLTKEGTRAVVLLHAFRKKLEICGPDIPRLQGETYAQYVRRAQPEWGLVENVHHLCKKYNVEHLLIENKASGLSVVQMMTKLFIGKRYSVSVVDPRKLDKVARMIQVQPEFAAGMVYAPYAQPKKPYNPERDGDRHEWVLDNSTFTSFASMVIDECAVAPRGRYDDLVDSTCHALHYLRSQGFLERREEQFVRNRDAGMQYKQVPPLYQV